MNAYYLADSSYLTYFYLMIESFYFINLQDCTKCINYFNSRQHNKHNYCIEIVDDRHRSNVGSPLSNDQSYIQGCFASLIVLKVGYCGRA